MLRALRRALFPCVPALLPGVLLSLGALASLGACGKGDGPAAPAGAGATDVPVSGLRLLDAGRGEKAPLRFRYAKGTKQVLVLEATTSFGASIPGPAMTTTGDLTLEVTDVEPDGTATVETSTGGMTMSGGPAGVTAPAALAKLSSRARMRLSPRGEVLANELNMDTAGLEPELRAMVASMQASLKETLGQIGVVWPEEPLGPGARWVFRRKMNTGMADADVNVETTLVARDGDRVTLSSQMKVAMDAQDIEVPGSGRKVHLKGMVGHGTVQQVVTLTSPASTLDLTMTIAMEMELPGRTSATAPPPQKLELTTTQRLRPKD